MQMTLKYISIGLIVSIMLLALAWQVGEVHAQNTVATGLVGYWSLDDVSIEGEVAHDTLANSDGLITGDPEVVAGKFNEALAFDGTSWVEIPAHAALDSSTLSFGFWFQSDSVIDPYCYFSKYGDDNNKLQICTNWWGVKNGGTWIDQLVFDLAGYFDGEWHYGTGVIGEDGFYRYFDGELVDSDDADASLSHLDETSFFLATMPAAGNLEQLATIITMDEISIYDRALSEDEVQQNYHAAGFSAAVQPGGKLSTTWSHIRQAWVK